MLPAITIVLLAISLPPGRRNLARLFVFVICIASLLAFGFLVWTSTGALENLPKRIAARAVAVRLKDAVFRGASLSWK